MTTPVSAKVTPYRSAMIKLLTSENGQTNTPPLSPAEATALLNVLVPR